MENNIHSDTELFDQLGLESTEIDIKFFIQTHRPLDPQIKLSEAPFWTKVQSKFLDEQIVSDADWVTVIDKLNASLR